jgi:hypothetical protein
MNLFAPKKPAPEPAPVVETPAPATGITQSDVERIVGGAVSGVAQQLADVVGRLGQKVEELASRQPQVVVQQPFSGQPAGQPVDLDAEIDHAVLTGSGAAQRIRALVDREVNKAIKPLQDYGVNTIGELSRRVTTTGMKYYQRYKKEIDERLAILSPDTRANPVVIETVYNSVVGQHADELAKEAAEAAVRQAQEPPAKPAVAGTGTTGAPKEASDVPDIETFLGSKREEGFEALQHKGDGRQNVSQDDFARSMGYKDWATYMKTYQDLLNSEGGGNA